MIQNEESTIMTYLPQLNENFIENYDNLPVFLHLRKSKFISFFIDHGIDIPISFKKSKSLKRRVFELPILKFSNMLMRAGKQEQSVKFLIAGFLKFLNNTNRIKFKKFDE
jgi:hypothetical protein